ncbi:hypothetical protein IW261DRAFT_834746 [Armillaria novae-zelandiae]|uniref:Uncharacterized protein n=1 Tax=Armillaria novae-zelandiae TaxID=153914 RepID=A0AA39NTH3_9AGAR|nr:hypothetical protein IW261DRAFT_834746 [Armillaria novae-zelandiae]
MTTGNHFSATSLSRYAMARSPGDDIYNGSTSRDFCISFWGPDEAGVLCAWMRGAECTTDELQNFWKERCVSSWRYTAFCSLFLRSVLEEQYGNRLMELSGRRQSSRCVFYAVSIPFPSLLCNTATLKRPRYPEHQDAQRHISD